MAQDTDDNVDILSGITSASVATDYVSGNHYQYVKLAWGADGTANLVDAATGKYLPIQLYTSGGAVSSTSNSLHTYIKGSDVSIDAVIAEMGITAVNVEGTTLATVPVMISGTTAIGGAIAVKGTGLSADFVYIAGFDGATAVGVTGDVAVSGTVGITTATNVSLPVTGDVAVSGTVTATGTIGITTAAGVTLDVSGSVVDVTGDVAVSGAVTVSGLSMGPVGSSAAIATTTDSIVVQGTTNAYPVFTHLGFITADGTPRYIGHSGDALKVAITDASISATVNVGTVVGVENTETYLAVSGTSSGASDANPITVQVTGGTLSGIDGTVTVAGTVAVSSATVTATDLDIRGLTFGDVGNSGDVAATTDSVVVQGVSGAFPVGTVLHGTTDGAGGEAVALGVTWEDNTPLLRTVIDSRGISNATAVQIQGRTDGSTAFPIAFVGLGPTSDVSPEGGLLGVTFDIVDGMPIIGGTTAPQGSSLKSVATLIHGVSGTSIFPIGFTGNGDSAALNVNMVNADGISFDLTIDTDLAIGNTLGNPVPIQGACADAGDDVYGVFITGTGSTTEAWPIFVQGWTSGGGTGEPVGVTFQNIEQLAGLSAGLSAMNHSLSGICAGIDGLDSVIDGIHNQESFTNIERDVATARNNLTSISANFTSVLNDGTSEVNVKVNPPARVVFASLPLSPTAQFINDETPLKSGVRIKLHPDATGIAWIGNNNVKQNDGYPLSAGEEIFIEIDKMDKIWAVTSSGQTNMTIFALGF